MDEKTTVRMNRATKIVITLFKTNLLLTVAAACCSCCIRYSEATVS